MKYLIYFLIICTFFSCKEKSKTIVNNNINYNDSTEKSIEWQKCLGGSNSDFARTILQTNDGGYIIAGNSLSNDGDVSVNHGDKDVWIVKIDAIGSIQWQKSFGGSLDDEVQSIQLTSDGGYIIACTSFSNNGDVTVNHGNCDFWIIKLNSSGVIQWQKSYGGTSNDYTNSIQQTNDGGYIIAGFTSSNDGDVKLNHGAYDYWIVKINQNGIIQWQKTYGGPGDDEAFSIVQINDGYVIAGNTTSDSGDVLMNHNKNNDYWIIKIDLFGNLIWQKSYGGSSNELVKEIHTTNDGGFIVTGSASSVDFDVTGNNGGFDYWFDYWVIKLNSKGDLQWGKCIGGSRDDGSTSICQTHDGGYVVVGYTGSSDKDVVGNHGDNDMFVAKLTPYGNLLWTKSLGGTGFDEGHSIILSNDGGYVLAGSANVNDGNVSGLHGNAKYADFWIVKLK